MASVVRAKRRKSWKIAIEALDHSTKIHHRFVKLKDSLCIPVIAISGKFAACSVIVINNCIRRCDASDVISRGKDGCRIK